MTAVETVEQERPEAIRVLGRTYDLSYVFASPLGVQAVGLCDNANQEITVLEGQTPLEEADTVLHEVIHAIDFVTGLDLEEKQVRHLASCLIGVFQDNPEFALWLAQEKNQKKPHV